MCHSKRPNPLLFPHPQRLSERPDVTVSLKVLLAEQPQAEPRKEMACGAERRWQEAAPTLEAPRAAPLRQLPSIIQAIMQLQGLQFSASRKGQ